MFCPFFHSIITLMLLPVLPPSCLFPPARSCCSIVQTCALSFSIALTPMSELPPVSFKLLTMNLTYVKWIVSSFLEKIKAYFFFIKITKKAEKPPVLRPDYFFLLLFPLFPLLAHHKDTAVSTFFFPPFSCAGCQAHRKEGEGKIVIVLTRIRTE